MTKYNLNEEEASAAVAAGDRQINKDVRLTGFKPTDNIVGGIFDEPRTTFDMSNRLGGINVETETNKVTISEISAPPNDPERGLDCSSGPKWVLRRARRSCTKKILYRRIPVFDWLPRYNKEFAISDLVAGITVGLTVIPQAIAYASVAGLPTQYGLYSSFMACFVYTILGPSKDVPVGPTAIAAILTKETLQRSNLGAEFAVALTFVSGCVTLMMGLLQLGFLIDFISGPVSVGFTSAAAIIIATSQVKDILGLNFNALKFLDSWKAIFEHIGETRLWDAVLGVTCMAVLLVLRKLKDIRVTSKDAKEPTPVQKVVINCLWFMSTARNIFVVIICGVGCYLLEHHLGSSPVVLSGYVKPGLPKFQPPPVNAVVGNETYNFGEMVSALGSGCFVVPLISLLETIAISKVFSDGKPIDATQEMLALGACNILSSFVSSIPVSGGLSRGAVNNASGVKTTMGGVYTGLMVLISLQFFTPYFTYIPKAALAAVIIAAVVFMVEFHVIKPMWRTKKMDLIPAITTFLCCLFIRLELGIVIGIGVNLLFLLYASARPTLHVHKAVSTSGYEYLVITPDRSLVFPSVEYVRAVISKQGLRQGNAVPVVIDSTHIQAADFTAAKGIKSLVEDFAGRGQPLLFHNLKPSIVEIFRGVRPSELKCSASETELNDYLKEYSNPSTTSPARH
ncbi:sodium-independent sulfate anion transporter-like [Athalia rosae]|uniref:sodium-independent sulfate anion transporter-like n=1 Tax=Athalia rosae TaxID=37344 RepID=UPI002034907D|nr:sodium-independent sulfate anion transporter-like [Athalia rosae]XP_048515873.1 sodium-independent sulfate anion transporter-like [Athalia rosae]XP_048515874.1 sodium-independent sulfate anion transporter-like [Athalia rosae]XP_048515875.1 sodium-independent sulfate anion transporter-like [Athalia rosae]XP_048515876.1 sodium-independent sulfate anion transporter-like [Athalia rosae]XP_048515877.1 sodium-independent sulfate anion transporter-like [Athalia rosae]